MAPHEIIPILPRRHRPARSTLFFLAGGFSLLTLCLFMSRLPGLPQITSLPAFGSSSEPQQKELPGMTSWGIATAPSPHHDSQAAAPQMPLGDGDEQGAGGAAARPNMAYGTSKHPPLKDDPPVLVRDLPKEHVPTYSPRSPTQGLGGGKRHGNRLVVVGDVHGNVGPLKALLRKLDFDHKGGDHLVLVGDMITKGPNSRGVVELAMEVGASAVRGNHEDRVLAAAREMHRMSVDGEAGGEGEEAGHIDVDGNGGGAGEDGDAGASWKKDHAHRVAKSLSRAQLAWLRDLPVILRIPQLPDAREPPFNAETIAVVHGGLVPGVPLEKQDPWAVMNMRSLKYPRRSKSRRDEGDDDDGDYDVEEVDPDAVAVPIDGREGEPWSHAWNRHQNHLPAHRTLAIYGHDAKAGLQADLEVDISPYYHSSSSSSSTPPSSEKDHNDEKTKASKKKKHGNKKGKKPKETGLRYAFGLDSGCGHGKRLSALVIEAAAPGVVRWRVEQVGCSS